MSLPALRAPREHGQILALPPLDQVGALLERNQSNLQSAPIPSIAKSLADLRALARREILAAATQYHREAGEAIPEDTGSTWLVAGHQPELFHPGVWFKNFVLHRLARQHGAVSLNLVVDTDSAKPALLHVPAGARLARVPFDRSTTETPYEERRIEDEAIFADLPRRLAPIIARWNFEPMLASFWREVLAQVPRTPLLGERFAAARRALERRWGCVQRELPMSRVCQTEAFAWFLCAIVRDLPAFHADYNQIVHEYRQEHGIRSRSHPVPDLARDGEWLEAPFWAWRQGQHRRGRLFVRRTLETWHLRVGTDDWPSIPCRNPADAVAGWHALAGQGYKVRSRALTTTLFARSFLADLFLHGIGGGIYDELTDRLIERHFRFPAPAFLVLSATLLLPLPRYPEAVAHASLESRRLRDLAYKPELFCPRNAETEPLIRAKQEWIAREADTHAQRVERFERLRAVNAQLHPYVESNLQQAQADRAESRRQIDWNAVASRRDYAFCLYPEEMLRSFFGR